MSLDYYSKEYLEFKAISNLAKIIFEGKKVYSEYPLFIEIYDDSKKVLDDPCALILFKSSKTDPTNYADFMNNCERELIVYDKNILYESTKFFNEYGILLNKCDLRISSKFNL